MAGYTYNRFSIDQTLKEADVGAELRDARKELNRNLGEAKTETFKKDEK